MRGMRANTGRRFRQWDFEGMVWWEKIKLDSAGLEGLEKMDGRWRLE